MSGVLHGNVNQKLRIEHIYGPIPCKMVFFIIFAI